MKRHHPGKRGTRGPKSDHAGGHHSVETKGHGGHPGGGHKKGPKPPGAHSHHPAPDKGYVRTPKRGMAHNLTKQVTRRPAMKKSHELMLQHDRAIKRRGSMGYGTDTSPPEVAQMKRKGYARRLKDMPL
jgi:hypothetical protein